MRLNIGFPVVQTDGRAVYGHVITKLSGMGRFTSPWCSASALRAPELRYYASYTTPSSGEGWLDRVSVTVFIALGLGGRSVSFGDRNASLGEFRFEGN